MSKLYILCNLNWRNLALAVKRAIPVRDWSKMVIFSESKRNENQNGTLINPVFAKQGFTVVEKEKMPQKFWKDCINCPKFPNCDEVCMEYSTGLKDI